MAKKQNKVKICLWTHVQNEASIIEKMLESAVDYIDYWVLVDNGSTDGTQDIIKNFFEKHKVEGKLYQSEIGWKGHGINRQHSWDFLKKTDHGCDYILRIDADEGIKVEEDFDWSIIPSQEAWSIIYQSGSHCVPRMWMWKWGLPWYWADDVAHETIHLEDGRQPKELRTMPSGFKHISLGNGNSYVNPIKYIQDILRLENQLHERFRDGSDTEKERYHLFYLCKSFNYTGYSLSDNSSYKYFPYGKDHLKSFLERGVFYYDKFLSTFGDSGEEWYIRYLKGDLLEKVNRTEEAIKEYFLSYDYRPDRAEALFRLFWHFYRKEDWRQTFALAIQIKKVKCPIDHDPWQLEIDTYYENNWLLRDAVAVTLERWGSINNNVDLLKESYEDFKRLYSTVDKNSHNFEDERKRLKGNLDYVKSKIKQLI
tara:strand:- start:1308 stop:2582 length:1275 start_codon:yes stop_codon:yes gene_type:complete